MSHLHLVGGTAAPAAPVAPSRTATLRAVLDAQLEPGLTVEQACHLDVPYLDDAQVPRGERILAERRLLRAAGLDIRSANDAPGAVVLGDERLFLARFPGLAHAVKVLRECGGVQPYTPGLPAGRG